MDAPQKHEFGRAHRDPRLSRLDRLRHSGSWSFPGPIGGFAATSVAGFDPVGQVFGTIVAYPGAVGLGPCFVTGSATRTGRTSSASHNSLLVQLNEARQIALKRAVAECRALGGDGIIGAQMSCTDFFSGTLDLTVEGTAVRARSLTRPSAPFTTHVGGQDLAKLLQAGWMPFALVFGTGVSACHYDQSMYRQTRRAIGAAGNREASGYTSIVNNARRQARRALLDAVRDRGGQGAVVQEMTLRFTERECPWIEERSDYVVEATILGSAMVSFEHSAPPTQQTPLTIMRLDARPEAAAVPQLGLPHGAEEPSLGDRAYAYWTTRHQAGPTGSSDAP